MPDPSDSRAPRRDRPDIPADYGIPRDDAGMLSWEWALERLEQARSYWVATTRADGRPHCVPTWGAWIEGYFYFGGGPNTRHMKNLEHNPHISMHLESADEVVIVEGVYEKVTNPDPALAQTLGDIYERKYRMREAPVARLRPRVAFAWREYPVTVTRFRFE